MIGQRLFWVASSPRSLAALLVVLYCCVRCVGEDASRPNIVWIMSEDNSIHSLRHYWPSGAAAPHIERLAQEGLTITRAYSCSPVCSVARTTLITGCYAPRLATQYHRRSQLIELPSPMQMFPALLRTAGYYTTNNAKEDYNVTGADAAWDESSSRASWRNRPRAATPFFHVQTLTNSHEGQLHFPTPAVTEIPSRHVVSAGDLPPYLPDTPLGRYTMGRYLDNIVAIDQGVGRLIDQLQADGLMENTYIFYFGDHGGVLPRSKGYLYDTGLHVPLIIRVPPGAPLPEGFTLGGRQEAVVEFVDLGPTVLSLAGIPTPKWMDGVPLLGRHRGDLSEFTEAFGYADRFDEKSDFSRSLHKGKYHYIRHFQPFYPDGLHNDYRLKMKAYAQWREFFHQGILNELQQAFFQSKPVEQLFDVDVDPYEIRNLADKPEMRQVLLDLRGRLGERMEQLPDLSLLPESYCVNEMKLAPGEFPERAKERVQRLLSVANAGFLDQSERDNLLGDALRSADPWEQYWARTVAIGVDGSFATEAEEEARKRLAVGPPVLQMRAAEFLWLRRGETPVDRLEEILARCELETDRQVVLNALNHARSPRPASSP